MRTTSGLTKLAVAILIPALFPVFSRLDFRAFVALLGCGVIFVAGLIDIVEGAREGVASAK